MTAAYATSAQYATFRGDESVSDVDRLLERASELLDNTIRARFAVDSDTNLPTDTDIAQALQDAACAQVEYWVEAVGEEHDIEGMGDRQASIGHLRMDHLPPELAPRALRFLANVGLMQPVPVVGQEYDRLDTVTA